MWVNEEAALRKHVGIEVVVGNLVQNRALRAGAHAVQAQSGQCTAAFRFANAWLEAYLKAKCDIATLKQTGSAEMKATKQRYARPVHSLITGHASAYEDVWTD